METLIQTISFITLVLALSGGLLYLIEECKSIYKDYLFYKRWKKIEVELKKSLELNSIELRKKIENAKKQEAERQAKTKKGKPTKKVAKKI